MKRITETGRLYLRELCVDDGIHFFELNNDPEVLQYTGDVPFKSVQEARDFISHYTHYAIHGFGRWAVEEKLTGTFMGWCGLRYTTDRNEVDLGFRFHKKYWGQGIATESAMACVQWAWANRPEIGSLVGRAMSENIASRRVLQKAGFRFVREDHFAGHNAMVYEIKRR